MKRITGIVSAACLLFCSAIQPAHAGDADYFKGKTLTYIVATKPGGGYDTYARLIAEYMAKQLGAEIRVKNVPGGGNIVGANQLFVARPDGLTIGTFNTGLVYAQLLRQPGVKFDLNRMSWIGSAAKDPRVIVIGKKSGVASVADLQRSKTPVLFGSSGVGSASHNETTMLSHALGLNVKVIPGFSGSEGEMSMMRGEIAGTLGSYSSLRPFVENGYGRFIARIGGEDSPAKSLPSLSDYAADEKGRKLIALIETMAQLARLTAGPPGIPVERLRSLREAYHAALTDPDLLARAAKLEIPIEPMAGDEVGDVVRVALNQPADVLAILAVSIKSEEKK